MIRIPLRSIIISSVIMHRSISRCPTFVPKNIRVLCRGPIIQIPIRIVDSVKNGMFHNNLLIREIKINLFVPPNFNNSNQLRCVGPGLIWSDYSHRYSMLQPNAESPLSEAFANCYHSIPILPFVLV
jgi:hypothetical protein